MMRPIVKWMESAAAASLFWLLGRHDHRHTAVGVVSFVITEDWHAIQRVVGPPGIPCGSVIQYLSNLALQQTVPISSFTLACSSCRWSFISASSLALAT